MAAACALSACGPRDDAFAQSSFKIHGQIAPRDVGVPTAPIDAANEFNGLYTQGPETLSCCWIAPHATLLVHKRGPANTLVAGFRLPNVPRFDQGQQISISFPGIDAPPRRADLQVDSQYLIKVPVPPPLRARTGLIPVTITCTVDYVPRRDDPPVYSLLAMLHLRAPETNDDTRPLGVVLLYLYFQ